MDNGCNKSKFEDLNQTITNEEETPIDPKNVSRSESPVFKCVNQHKTKRVSHCDSSDYDIIPSYQINQSVKRRTSGKNESETGDSILPLSPGFSPIPTFSQQFQPPSFHSLGTISKLGNLVKTENSKGFGDGKRDGRKKSGVFESLGMMDKDISWVSAMATPPPQVPGSGFNTIEKATFFPEDNFQNIQPRALFSPTHDDDFGCKPLSFSSESDEDSYKTDIRLSDVCATLNQLDVKSLEQMPNDCESTLNDKNDKDCETSPVIKMRKPKKFGGIKSKRKQDESKSAELDNKCESSFHNNEKMGDKSKLSGVNNINSQNTNFIDDDSFQSMSFTCIDELCKTLANTTQQNNSSAGSRTFENDCDKSFKDKSDVKSISKVDTSFQKQFYRSKVDSNISSVSSCHNVHSYAQAFETGQSVPLKTKRIDRSVAEKGVVRFDAFAKGSSTSDTVKRLHSELSVEKCKSIEKKLKLEDDESSDWDTMSKYLSESQLNVSDSEMFKTVEKLEKTLGSQESKVLGDMKEVEKLKEDKCEGKQDCDWLKDDGKVTSQIISGTVLGLKDSLREPQSPVTSTSNPDFAFKTSSGSEVTVTDLADRKQSSKTFQELRASTSIGGFCTGSGKQIQISGKALEKAKFLMAECEEQYLKETSEDLASKWIEEFQGTLENSSSCDKFRLNRSYRKCLAPSNVETEISVSEMLSQDKELLAEFSKSHESFQNLNKSPVVPSQSENPFAKKDETVKKGSETVFEGASESVMVGFSTALGSRVKITEAALVKAKELMANCDEASENVSQSLTQNWIQNFVSKDSIKTKNKTQMGAAFSTASGKNVKVTERALEKAKELMANCDETSVDVSQGLTKNWMESFVSKDLVKTKKETHSGATFSTASGKNVNVTEKALEKARELMTKCDQTSEDVSQSLTMSWMQNFDGKDPIKTKSQTPMGATFSTVSGKNVNVTEKSLEKAKELMAYCDQASEDMSQSLTQNWIQNFVSKDSIQPKNETQMGATFSTASGNTIKITEKALEKAKELLTNCDKTSEDVSQSLTKNWIQNFVSKDPDKTKIQTPMGATFSTASGNTIKITEKALEKAKELLVKCDETSDGVSQSLTKNWIQNFVSKDPVKSKNETQMGATFSTASGKNIKISEEALDKAKALMSKCNEGLRDACETLTKDWSMDFESDDQNKTQPTGAFSTASGTNIKITEKALEKTKELMANCDETTEDVSQSLTRNWMQSFVNKDPVKTKNETQITATFSTASGKNTKVTEEALEKAKEFVANCNGASEDLSQSLTKNWMENFVRNDPIKRKHADIETRFSTGSDDKVNVSGLALEKAKDFMSKCCVEALEMDQEDIVPDVSEMNKLMSKFSTASGKNVKVSGEALSKARTLMSKCDESSTKTCETLTSNWMKDFVISDPAKTEFDSEPQIKIPQMCFSTAAGSTVTVSGDALKKGRETLAEVWSQDLPDPSNPSLENHDAKLIFSKNRKEEDSGGSSVAKDERDATAARNPQKAEVVSNLTVDASLFSDGDWEEIIPSWLHVYNTSPSIASDRTEMSPVVSHEDGKSSNLAREYIVKSPVLGLGDRFYKKGKKRKREVEEEQRWTKMEERTSSKSFNVPYKDGCKKTSTKRTSLSLSLDFSAPFKKGKFFDAEVDPAAEQKSYLDVREKRMKAREQQENTSKEKKQVKPLKGSHLQKKLLEKQKKWMEAADKTFPDVYSDEFLKSLGVKEDVLRITVDSAADFKFSAEDFYGSTCVNNVDGIPAGDGCFLIPDDENKFGVKEMKRAFLASPGVQPNLVPDGWVENHYKWLVWKFSHYERSFPRFFGGRCLNPNNVMLQMKYRYDREIDRNERSALRKILERDDTSVKRMVLCVCGIKKVISGEAVEYELNLTDGWYSVPARSDAALTPFIEKEKLRIGTKLITQGAVLVNCEQGTSPLQASSDAHLRIFTNSTRRVRWDTKLGFQKNPHNFVISLSSILPQGGQISQVDIIVVRIYPMLYMEKTLEGHSVTRNQRAEEKAELEHCRLQEQKMEMLYDELSKCRMKDAQGIKKVHNYERDKNLCDSTNENSNFPDSQETNEDQNDSLKDCDQLNEDMLEKFQEKLNNQNLTRRNVSQFLRMKIVDYRKPDYNNPAILTVWNPNEEVIGLFVEGKVMSLMNVAVSKSSRTYKSLQMNTTRQTLYKEIASKAKYPARQLTPLREVASKVCPVFEEVDLVGIVAVIKDVSYGSRSSQIIYLADLEFHFVGIVFWGSAKDYGWENVLKVQTIVACSNLQWKKSCGLQEVPSLQVNESTVFTENPKHAHLKEEVERLKENMPESINDFLTKCEEKLTEKLEETKLQGHSSRNSSANDSIPKDSFSAKFRHVNGFGSKPTASSTPIKPFSFSYSTSEAEPSPIQKRIQKLQSYGEPPPLIPLIVSNNVRKLRKKF